MSIRQRALVAHQDALAFQERERIRRMEEERSGRVTDLTTRLRSVLGERVDADDISYSVEAGAYWVSDLLQFEVDEDYHDRIVVIALCQKCGGPRHSADNLLLYQPANLAELGEWLDANSGTLCDACESLVSE